MMKKMPTVDRRVRLPRFVAAMPPSERRRYEDERERKIQADTARHLEAMRCDPDFAGITESTLVAFARRIAVAERESYEVGYQEALDAANRQADLRVEFGF